MNPTDTRIAPVNAATLPPYAPTAYLDFSQPEHRQAFEKALAEVRGELGQEYPLVIGGERVKGPGMFESRNPSKPSEVLGKFQSGSKEQAHQAATAVASAPAASAALKPSRQVGKSGCQPSSCLAFPLAAPRICVNSETPARVVAARRARDHPLRHALRAAGLDEL